MPEPAVYTIMMAAGMDDPCVDPGSAAAALARGLRALGLPAAARECAEDAWEEEIAALDDGPGLVGLRHPSGDAVGLEADDVAPLLRRIESACAGMDPASARVTASRSGVDVGPMVDVAWQAVLEHAWEGR